MHLSDVNRPFLTILEAFDLIGHRTHGLDWSGSESAELRLGRRNPTNTEARQRGQAILKLMMSAAQNGSMDVIYTDASRRRVPYYCSTGFWLTAIYPDPDGSGEGVIELDDRYIYPAIARLNPHGKWVTACAVEKHRTGPVRQFASFEAAVATFFATSPTNLANALAWEFARKTLGNDDPWPKKTHGNDLINKARERQQIADGTI